MLLHQSRCKVNQNGQNHQDSGDGKGHTELTLFFCVNIEGNGQRCTGSCQTIDQAVDCMSKTGGEQQRCRLAKNTTDRQDASGDDTIHTAG